MTKLFFTTLLASALFSVQAQQSEDLIPEESVMAFSINNVNLLEMVSLDELVQYQFMEDVQAELFDGSAEGKTLKDSGIDFNQKLNVFLAQHPDYSITGMSFGVENQEKMFSMFDDFEMESSSISGVSLYGSYINRIAIKGNVGIMFRLETKWHVLNDLTDSIWLAQGNEPRYHFGWYEEFDYEQAEALEELYESLEELDEVTPADEEDSLPPAAENPTKKTYYELKDSIRGAMQNFYVDKFLSGLFHDKKNLVSSNPDFKKRIQKDVAGVFFNDQSRQVLSNNDFGLLRMLYPGFYRQMMQLYQGNSMLGEIRIEDNQIVFELDSKHNETLGAIYEDMGKAKFDKNFAKYIHDDNEAFFTYNVDMRQAYETAMDILIPLLYDSTSPQMSSIALFYDLLDEFINKDALFGTYKGGVFGTYNGIQKVRMQKIVWDYDEETYEYTEKEVETEEDMPVFTVGFSTERHDILDKILAHFARLYDEIYFKDGYWVRENAILNAMPTYFINANGLFIITNDEDLVRHHLDGYGGEAISKAKLKTAKKGGPAYAYVDLGKAIENIPQDFMGGSQDEFFNVLRGKTGSIEFTTTKTTKTGTSFAMNYVYEGEYENTGTYILDLINSLYVISK